MSKTVHFKDNYLSFREYAKVSLRYTLKVRPTLYFLVLPALVAFLFWSQFQWESGSFFSALGEVGVTMWLITLALIVTPFSLWRGLRKNYYGARFMHAPVDYTFSDSGMDMKSTVTNAQMAWEAFHTFYDFGNYGLLRTGNAAGFFLSFEALQLPATKSDFLGLLTEHHLKIK